MEAVKNKDSYTFNDFMNIMETLFGENGCPWDKAQTHESVKTNLIEESYEVIEAINNNDKENMCEELGDLLLQIAFHSMIAKKNDTFDINDVIMGISKKMIRRHPHVFSDINVADESEVLANWDEIKKSEKNYSDISDVLDNIPKSLPALMRAQKVIEKTQKQSNKSNEDSKDCNVSINQLESLISKLKVTKTDDLEHNMELIGNIIFEMIKISSFFKINAEISLTNTLETYITKFIEL